MKRKLIYLSPLLIFFALGGLFWQALDNDPSLLPSARIGKPVPPFSLSSLHDEQKLISEQQLKGQPALLNVWATWCPSCIVEHPVLLEISKQGYGIWGLNYKDVRSAAIVYLRNHGDPYTEVIFDQQGDLGLDLGVYGAPETYVINAEGQIIYRHVGIVTQAVWAETLKPMLDGKS